VSYSDFACVGCERTEKEIEECRIYQYRFKALMKQCPKQGPEPPKVIAEVVGGDRYLEIPTDLIVWKDPIRKDIKDEDVKDMATSFTMHGQIEPIVVDGPDEGGKYEGVCGRLRYEAMKRFPGRPILARVHKFMHPREKREWQLAENLHRRDLTTLQRAEAYQELYKSMREEFGGVHDKDIVGTIAKRQEELTGEEAPAEKTIHHYIRIAKELPEEIKRKVSPVSIFGIRHGLELLRLKDMPEKQMQLAEEFAREPMTVQLLKKRVDEVLSPPPPKKEIDTGALFTCPECGQQFVIIHAEPGPKHKLQRAVEVKPSGA